MKGIILNGGENSVVDGRPVDIDPALYGCGVPVMAIDHPTAQCGLRYPSIPEEEVLKDFVLGQCKAETLSLIHISQKGLKGYLI